MNNNKFYLTEPYKEAREKAEKDLDSWPNWRTDRFDQNWNKFAELSNGLGFSNAHKSATRKRNHAVIGILCLGLSIAIIIIWIGTYYAVRTNAITTLPQTQAAPHSRNGL